MRIAPDSVFYLQPGDVGVVKRTDTTEYATTECAATFHGMTVVVPLDAVRANL